jgi:outer membrane protein OmpA-like peptidoglycan-associated protein
MKRFRLLIFTIAAVIATRDGRAGWQTPGEIQVPKGSWQVPGDIQVPKGIEAVKERAEGTCIRRVTVIGDALFDFDKSVLRNDAEVTLAAAGPEIAKAGAHRVTIIGHTDGKGGDAYNDRLSEARARAVRDWLASHAYIPAAAAIKGLGKRQPVAVNTKPDGSDDPVGRQKNRRVEIEIDTCG